MRAVLTSVTALAVLCTLPVFGPLVSGEGWWVSSAVAVLAVALTGAAYRTAHLTLALLPLLQAGVVACTLTAIFTPGDALLGFVPTPQSIDTLLALIDEGRARIEHDPPPLTTHAALSLIIAIGFSLLAIVADFFAVTARAPALVALPLVTPLLVPLAVQEQGIGVPAFALAATGYLVLLAIDGWERAAGWGGRPQPDDSATPVLGAVRHVSTGAGVAVAAIVLALLLPLGVPGLANTAVYDLAGGVRLGSETVTTTHPMVSLRRDLASPTDRDVLEYRTPQASPEYLRMYVLDVFDGENWTMSPLSASSDSRIEDDSRLPAPPGRADDSAEQVSTEITLADGGRAMDFLPAPYPPREIDVGGEWFADPESLMIFTTNGPASGMSYEVTSSRLDLGPRELAESTPGPQNVEEHLLDVPGSTDPQVAELTRSITEDAESPHERAVALQNWFTSGNRFEYSLQPPAIPAGADPLTHFLFDSRVGYCEQFAAAMTLMARQAGIPARVAVGYTAGERVSGDEWVVTESDAHAWPELYFKGHGWLRFEPTPSSSDGQGSATVPSYATPSPEDSSRGGSDDAAPSPGENDEPSSSEEEADQEEDTPESPADSDPDTDGVAGGTADEGNSWLPALGTLVAAALLFAAPALARLAVRRFRFATAATSTGTVEARAAWRELRDDLLDLGLSSDPAESPRAIAQRLAAEHNLSESTRESLWRIAMAEESARYAPEPDGLPGALSADLRAVRAGLAASFPRTRRVRALLAPRSLLRLPRSAVRRRAKTSAA
ncbi:transglutaminase family protein [Allosalinactinospora lopnorensis]|uniref:transglutaminase family protein n=1 Tax=Allosalinactinospora lopnorensis TaxID=1352348 RepID=UPI000A7E27A9|nr:DUF3488 and transglutaminase-like domain-containing protein [Allosalinactinospora lopnorensis]